MNEVARVSASTADSTGKAAKLVDDLLTRASRSGARAIALARTTLGGLFALLWPATHASAMARGFDAQSTGDWAITIAAILAFVAGVVTTRYLKDHHPSQNYLAASVTLDALLVNGLLLFLSLYPAPNFVTVLTLHASSIVYLAMVAAGFRLNVFAARVGVAVNSIFFSALVISEIWRFENTNVNYAINIAVSTTMLITTAVIATRIATRTRRLVLEGAMQALLAERAKQKLGSYVSKEVAEHAMSGDSIRMGGERRSVAVLFTDLRGFTAFSEHLEPEELVEQLNAYLRAMVQVITKHGGVVDKYIGDAIMAVFGAPNTIEKHADKACLAAIEMQDVLREHNSKRKARGLPALAQGVGVHLGDVIAGHVGTEERASYTVMGDTVNLASRLESSTKKYQVDSLFSAPLVDALSDESLKSKLERHAEIQVRGRQEGVVVYALKSERNT